MENSQTCEKETSNRVKGEQVHLEMFSSQLRNNTEEHILLGQVLHTGREASNCLRYQYRVLVDRVERMTRLMELEKSFWEKEAANVDGSGKFCCLYFASA